MADLTLKLTDSTTRKNLMSLYSPEEPVNIASPMDVFLRVRGYTNEESKKKKDKCIEITNENRIVVHLPKDSATYKNVQNGSCVKHQFVFSKIFGEDIDQRNFYTKTVHNMVQRFLWGENCLIFAYGATNSGKTHTVQGLLSNPGVLPRSIDVIFNSIGNHLLDPVIVKPNFFDNITKLSIDAQKQERAKKDRLLHWGCEFEFDSNFTSTESLTVSRMTSSVSSEESVSSYRSCDNLSIFKNSFSQLEHRIREESVVEIPNVQSFTFSIWISFAEIYNEFVYDLFQPFTNTRSKKRTTMKLSEDKNGNVFIKSLQRICVTNAEEAMKLLIVGTKNLRFAATSLNQNSSRSHCIFTIEIIRTPDKENPRVATISRLSFCDLAGSERYSKTRNVGDRLKEACNINTSLLVLGRCISTLRTNQNLSRETMKLIPFRESKLTRLFQFFFTHRSAISMIVNISPEPGMCDETLNVLKFSALAEKVIIIPQNEVKRKRAQTKASILMQNAAARNSVPWISSEDEDDSAESESDVDREELFDYIDKLQSEIKKLNRENENLEFKIRKEVSEEAGAEILQLEKFYSEKIQEQRELAEDYAEKRIALCIKETDARKRQKDDDSDYEDCDAEVEEKERIIKELEAQKEEVINENRILKDEIKALRQSNTRMSISQANIRRKSSMQLFENSYKDYRSKSSVNTSWLTVTSEEGNEAYLDLQFKYEQLSKKMAIISAQLLEAKDEISGKNELITVYEQRLANQADKKRRLTLLKNETLNKEFQNMKITRNEDLEEKENADAGNQLDNCPQPKGAKTTPKHLINTDNSASDASPSTPETVKKLFKPSVNVLLTSPIDEVKESEANIHSRVLEQIQLE